MMAGTVSTPTARIASRVVLEVRGPVNEGRVRDSAVGVQAAAASTMSATRRMTCRRSSDGICVDETSRVSRVMSAVRVTAKDRAMRPRVSDGRWLPMSSHTSALSRVRSRMG